MTKRSPLMLLALAAACVPTTSETSATETTTGTTGGTTSPTSSSGATSEATGGSTSPAPDLPPPCPVGSLGCPCTGGGACDATLTCEAGTCVEGCQVGSLGCSCTQGGGCDAGLSCDAGECVEGTSPPCMVGNQDDCCGDTVLDEFEECDEGYLNADDADCTASCKVATCGDGLVHEPSEACDGDDFCTAECTFKTCGDGVVDPWEWCDPVRSDPECTPLCTDAKKLIFITSTHYAGGDLGGIAGADEKCQSRADAAGFFGTFKAFLASSTEDSPETSWDWHNLPYTGTDGMFLFTPPNFGTYCNWPIMDEFGNPHPGGPIEYDGQNQWYWILTSYVDEEQTPSCSGWTGGMTGKAVTWISCVSVDADCSYEAPIACVEQ